MHDVLKLGKMLAVVKFLDSVLASIYQKATAKWCESWGLVIHDMKPASKTIKPHSALTHISFLSKYRLVSENPFAESWTSQPSINN